MTDVLAMLPPQRRAALVAYPRRAEAARLRAEGKTYAEIGRQLGVSRTRAEQLANLLARWAEPIAQEATELGELAELELGKRARNAIMRTGIKTRQRLREHLPEMALMENVGAVTLQEIARELDRLEQPNG